ncbi:MAG: Ig-like domain-containing protein [Bacteroidota bacterium]
MRRLIGILCWLGLSLAGLSAQGLSFSQEITVGQQPIYVGGQVQGFISTTILRFPQNGKITITVDSVFTGQLDSVYSYVANQGFYGPDTLVVVHEIHGFTDTFGVEILVLDPNGIFLNDDREGAFPGLPVTFNVLRNDRGKQLKVSSISAPQNGTATLLPNNLIEYIADSSFIGVDTFSYVACDSAGNCDSAWIIVDVAPFNGHYITLHIFENVPTTFALPITDTAYSIDVQIQTKNGTVSFKDSVLSPQPHQTDSLFLLMTYTPDSGFTGQDTLLFLLSSMNDPNTFMVPVIFEVKSNTPSFSINTDNFQTSPGNSVLCDVLANDQGAGLTVTSVDTTSGIEGSITLNSDFTITYNPPANQTGNDVFFYTACDSLGNCSRAAVYISITSATPGGPLLSVVNLQTNKNTPLYLYMTDSLGLQLSLNTNGTIGQVQAVRLDTTIFDPATGQSIRIRDAIEYFPATNYLGTDTFTVDILFPGGPSVGQVMVVVEVIDDPSLNTRMVGMSMSGVTTSTELGSFSSSSGFTLYPNPTNDVATISWKGTGTGLISLFASDGRLVLQRSIDAGESVLQLSAYSPGLYQVVLRTNTGIQQKSLLIRR